MVAIMSKPLITFILSSYVLLAVYQPVFEAVS